ncbi:hypothetical protein LTR91_019549 [Friedmanniomyces endolithicus]|uniref:Nucleoporin NUP49/NSP49 n=1 Tax=Friedmanniomyces endolithicus TaxID=329885 RepID=A0AAN6HAY1_9PEZI|nr:hypothetical protein LTS00_014567 [Friedmanniomyces endolithicus]KAK0277559.1 hypothetical protein LTR35_009961 [Friedmanniomyces endolithicus]KAK0919313.1 hypothetical protein LTR57_010881 [Friedmanniomyces endolithicus]KAK0962206.1 hypothetical protein LTR91_019549 [Friedmanniomyces endolithicus]KAK0980895.1 hypothetical protein LTR54_015204 [Friedmanniomyces endolithicus]
MAFGRSNSLSLNTGASNNLFMSKPTAFQAIIASLASPKRNSGTPFTMLTPQPQPPPQPPSQPSLTKATSSGQQNQRQQNNPPPSQAGSLFGGGAAAQSQAQTGQAGGLFGATQAAAQPQQQTGGLFGNTQAAQPQATSLFGNSQAAQPPATGLFGNTQAPQAQSSSLFGNTNAQPSTSLFGNTNAQPSTSLFGNTNAQPSTSLFGNTNAQPSASSFGNTNAQPSTSLFGNSLAQPQPQQTGSMFANMNNNTSSSNLFGNSTTAPPNNNTTGGSSLFGSLGQQSQPQSNMFGMSNQNQNQPTNNSSVFGMSAIAPQQLNASLLSASQYRASNLSAPFVGTLSMGQPGSQSTQSQQQQQQAGSSGLGNTIGAVKIHTADLRGTTRFADCHESIQEQFESVDTMIQKQERFCREIQALLQKHEQDILCLPPSVQVISDLAENVETLLSRDAQSVQSAKAEASRQRRDFERAGRVAENLMLGAVGYAVPSSSMAGYGNGGHGGGEGEEGFDTDLIGNYFVPMVAALQVTLEGYAANLADIEGHLGVIEGSAVAQARRLAAKRAGVGSGGAVGGDETVRELAETLTGFEQSLLGVAGVVRECREGVDGLVLGRLGGRVGAGAGGGMARRPW